jgi:hypothetical protein
MRCYTKMFALLVTAACALSALAQQGHTPVLPASVMIAPERLLGTTTGFCVTTESGFLTGHCEQPVQGLPIGRCSVTRISSRCPSGAKAIRPSKRACTNVGVVYIDTARTCP